VKISTLVTWAALLVLGQLLITQWTVHAAGNRDVLDYVSFAGTVVGMILAILAIVYSYLANAAQKSDSESLRAQVSNLNDAITRANQSGTQFSSELGRLEEIREALSQVSANSAAALAVSTRLEQQITSLRASEKRTKPKIETANSGFDLGQVATALAARALAYQVVLYYISIVGDPANPAIQNPLEEEFLFSMIGENPQRGSLREFYQGEQMGYYWIFYDLALFEDAAAMRKFKEALLRKAKAILTKPIVDAVLDSNKLTDNIKRVIERLEQ
jgi:hypothetical protein